MEKVVQTEFGNKELIWTKGPFSFSVAWKQIGTTLVVLNCFSCVKSLSKQNVEWFYPRSIFSRAFESWERLPDELGRYSNTIKAVRRITLWPFLSGVSQDKVMSNFPNLRKSEIQYHYYVGDWREVYKSERNKLIPSSSEIVVIDKIKSVPDFSEILTNILKELERDNKTTVFVPKVKNHSSRSKRPSLC
ncbi:MAG: hypothetical protein IPL71_24330 [Anaerolineales bacterium]|uniref:hypothetical protein n=1 Tax=Candidatus Villigracilis proximus TaxID=3140683 RepID=UPI0031354922|nr:hypothetical protein [Anaerolineales bacterium]